MNEDSLNVVEINRHIFYLLIKSFKGTSKEMDKFLSLWGLKYCDATETLQYKNMVYTLGFLKGG